jgi:hypothetical protein
MSGFPDFVDVSINISLNGLYIAFRELLAVRLNPALEPRMRKHNIVVLLTAVI